MLEASPLLDAIAATPDDPAPWAVYADLLQTTDDPRGELISLMMERERRPSPQLFAAQRHKLARHEQALLPAIKDVAVGWRRGFVSELRLFAPAQLAEVARDPSLRFVEAATLAIDPEHWSAWRAALTDARMPWRRLRVEVTGDAEELEAAPFLACAPGLQTLRIDADGAALRWDGARGPQLALLVVMNAGEVSSLDDAELPRLEELRLLGDSVASEALRTSLAWNRLTRVVLAETDEAIDDEAAREAESGPSIVVMPPRLNARGDEDDYDDDEEEQTEARTTAFLVIGGELEPALLVKLATRLSVPTLSARIGTVRWLQRPLMVVQLFGNVETELMPYGIGIALENVLDPAPPIALVEIDEHRAARFLVLGPTQTRATHEGEPDETVRGALDLALGFDPGTAILQDICDELAASPLADLIGGGGASQLTMIDPSSAPLFTPDAQNGYAYGYDDEDEDSDEDDYDHTEDDELEAAYEEPAPLDDDDETEPDPVTHVTVAAEIASIVAATKDGEADDDPDDEPAVTEDALEAPPERVERWLELYDHWDDRAVAVDDEPHEVRWPDPERVEHDFPHDLERRIAEPTCARHELALVDCRGCDVLHCVACGGEDWCALCFAAMVEKALAELPAKTGAV